MKYVSININGWLNGTICRFLTKAEKAIWGDFIVCGGEGEGRIGYIEEFKHVPYPREALLAKTHCFTPEDIKAFDSCYQKCLDGVSIGGELDKARISIDEYGCIKIENWDTYQHSDYPQGYTEAECKEAKRLERETYREGKKLPIEKEMGRDFAAAKMAKEAHELLSKANMLNPEITERTIAQCKADDVHDKGGNYLEGTKVKRCKCNVCGRTFKLPIEKDEITEVVDGLVIGKTCKECRKDN